MQYKRVLDLERRLKQKSHFLFGARSTGKTSLFKKQLSEARVYDLLGASEYTRLLRRPEILREELEGYDGPVVIDEIQKLPELLNEVHWIIENRKNVFLLTGSSARKLKHGGANLLGGRAWLMHLFPLASVEITDFDLLTYLNRGGIPNMYLSKNYEKELQNYVDLYIKEEIKAEALTRNVQSFNEFLELIALSNGEEINLTQFSSDCGVSTVAIKSYISILEDTQLGFMVQSFTGSKKRKAIVRPKFYLFDVGVSRHLRKQGEIREKSSEFGKALEHFIAMELRAYMEYTEKNVSLHYWRTTSQIEVDFVIPGKIALEVKATDSVNSRHLKGLKTLKEEDLKFQKYIVVSLDLKKRITDKDIEIYPVHEFLQELWAGDIF